MSKHFAFVVPPAHGHVNPTLPLVEELVARGHRVTYVTGADLMPTAAAAGATPLEMRWEFPRPSQDDGKPFKFTIEAFGAMLLGFQEQAELSYPSLVAHFQRDRPDAVCFDMMGTLGPLIADKLGVPMVTLLPSMASNEHFDMRTLLTPEGAEDDGGVGEVFAKVFEAQAKFRAANGLPAPTAPSPLAGPSAPLNLVFVPREFQVAGDTFDDRFRFLGPSMGSRADAGGWQPPADGSPVLFVSLGTAFNDHPEFFAQCVEAFGDSPWHVVMAVGERVEIPPVPGNFTVAAYFPQPVVLASATVFLSHTGMNSTMESLYYGVPLVSVPQMPEQALNGGRAEELGFGRRLDSEAITPELLRRTVDEVANDPVIRANVTKFGEQLRAVDGPALGADALEELLG
ncbi:macrolide family glycosyltransferase [Amycolatopsis samaneae]|uniref:Macrolide family glycosyltransferase n=1 Tax=Amycolatopsis samaneae TaxID=664691 RepID=A0ABW5GFX3_9PSEU